MKEIFPPFLFIIHFFLSRFLHIACSMALTEEAAMEIENKTQKSKESNEYEALFERIKNDLINKKGLS